MSVTIEIVGKFPYGNGTLLNAYTGFCNASGEPIYLVRVNRREYAWPEGKPQSFQTPRNIEALKRGAVDFLQNNLGRNIVDGQIFEITIVRKD